MEDLLAIEEYLIVARGGNGAIRDPNDIGILMFLEGILDRYPPRTLTSLIAYRPNIASRVDEGMLNAFPSHYSNRLIHDISLGNPVKGNPHALLSKGDRAISYDDTSYIYKLQYLADLFLLNLNVLCVLRQLLVHIKKRLYGDVEETIADLMIPHRFPHHERELWRNTLKKAVSIELRHRCAGIIPAHELG